MKNNTITGRVTDCQRMPSSINGNPRYRIVIGDKIFVTSPDSSLGYTVTNYRNQIVTATWRILRGQATLESIENVTK